MGKYIVQYAIPAIFTLWFAWAVLKVWYLKLFPKTLKSLKGIGKASDKYQKEIEK